MIIRTMMNEKQLLLLRARVLMLNKEQRNDLHNSVRKRLKAEIDDNVGDDRVGTDTYLQDITDDHVCELMNQILIEKYGETAVYDYLRKKEGD